MLRERVSERLGADYSNTDFCTVDNKVMDDIYGWFISDNEDVVKWVNALNSLAGQVERINREVQKQVAKYSWDLSLASVVTAFYNTLPTGILRTSAVEKTGNAKYEGVIHLNSGVGFKVEIHLCDKEWVCEAYKIW
ncbi:hypothetical protein FT641_19490 [Bacillus paranthracis]|uniref:hypothetical protein n=1 Tax=Bacillus paranthracis TaxID=2026186 RepID=UPI00187998E0|nr:hypothetical protein [Bacillus paranthracis]MBE7114250.1 hypothetical protein [Bacillus paranthracis]MBE7154877.1 hypothetical protein [Bacillus paranthracis]